MKAPRAIPIPAPSRARRRAAVASAGTEIWPWAHLGLSSFPVMYEVNRCPRARHRRVYRLRVIATTMRRIICGKSPQFRNCPVTHGSWQPRGTAVNPPCPFCSITAERFVLRERARGRHPRRRSRFRAGTRWSSPDGTSGINGLRDLRGEERSRNAPSCPRQAEAFAGSGASTCRVQRRHQRRRRGRADGAASTHSSDPALCRRSPDPRGGVRWVLPSKARYWDKG